MKDRIMLMGQSKIYFNNLGSGRAFCRALRIYIRHM